MPFKLFDAHCHLQDKRYGESVGGVINRACKAGVETMACNGTRPDDWEDVKILSEKYPSIIPFFGVHPWYSADISPDWLDTLQNYLLSVPSGVGEIGLDFAIENIDQQKQEMIFRKQLRLANILNRPVSIHCRKAWQRLVDIIREEEIRGGGMVHSYSGSTEMIPLLENLGLYLSFSGSITRLGNIKGRANVQKVNIDRLCIETDSPDILPEGSISGLNEPSNLIKVIETIAEIRGLSPDQAGQLTFDNTIKLFERILP